MANSIQRLFSGRHLYMLMAAGAPRHIHASCISLAGGKWRERHGLSNTGTSYGPLTDLPDWTYADGRPSPLTSKRRHKREARKLYLSKRIKTMLMEVDLAKIHSEQNKTSSLDHEHDHIDDDDDDDKQ